MTNASIPTGRSGAMILTLAALALSASMQPGLAGDAGATILAYPCAAVDPELYSHQEFVPDHSPYNVPFEQWDEAAFDALKQRMTECITPANRKRTGMILFYLEGPYGPRTQVLRMADKRKATAAGQVADAAEIRSSLGAALADPSPTARRKRLASIAARLEHTAVPANQKAELRDELARGIQDATEAEAADAEAQEQADTAQHDAEVAEQQARQATEQKAAEQQAEQRRQALAAEAAAQAEQQRRQVEAQARAAAEAQRQALERQEQAKAAAAEVERYYEQRAAQLSPEVVGLLARNPALKAPTTRDDALKVLAVIEGGLFALDACRAHDGTFGSEWTETQRRLGLVQQLLISYYGVTPGDVARGAALRHAKFVASLQQTLDNDEDARTQTCQDVMALTSALLDFSR